MEVHTALGQARGAAGVRQQSHVAARHLTGRCRALPGGGIAPWVYLPAVECGQVVPGQQPGLPGFGNGVGMRRTGIKTIGEVGHDQVLQPLRHGQGITGLGQLGRQVCGGDGHTRIGVGDVVFQLLGPVHRVHRHHHRIGPQDGEMCHHQLGAVLHTQHHAVALAHSQHIQLGGKLFHRMHHLGIGEHRTHKHQRRLVRVPPRIHRQVVPQRRGRGGDRMGQAFGPEFVVRAHGRQLLR